MVSKAAKGQKKKKGAPLSSGTGRRKSAVARVWLRKGSGKVIVNELPYQEYFDIEVSCIAVRKPLELIADKAKQFDITANVRGSGVRAQADAVKLGIARALVSFDEQLRSSFRSAGLLTVDARLKERKKFGQRGARRKFQFVKR